MAELVDEDDDRQNEQKANEGVQDTGSQRSQIRQEF
jgi:hypothetical protein